MGLGAVVVTLFFLCGGYLIAKSMERLKTFSAFWKARIRRLFPALIFVVTVTVFCGAFLTDLAAADYFASAGTWKYFLNACMIPVHDLPGVFTQNIGYTTVNGSLWTLPVEFACYVGCYLLYKLGIWGKRKFWYSAPLVVAGIGGILLISSPGSVLRSVIRPGMMFYLGMLAWNYREYIKLNGKVAAALAVLFVPITYLGYFEWGIYLFFPYIMFYCWFGLKQERFSGMAKWGKYSYGIYLCGYPVQQTIVSLCGGSMNPYCNMLLAVPVACILGAAVYHIVEKRF